MKNLILKSCIFLSKKIFDIKKVQKGPVTRFWVYINASKMEDCSLYFFFVFTKKLLFILIIDFITFNTFSFSCNISCFFLDRV